MRLFLVWASIALTSGVARRSKEGPPGGTEVLPTETPAATSAPTEQAEFYPLGTRTGVAFVDDVISAVERKDEAKLRELMRFYKLPCEEERPTAPSLPVRCLPGEPRGTPHTGIFVIGIEAAFNLEGGEQTPLFAAAFLRDVDPRLYGVTREFPYESLGIPGEFFILFASGDGLLVDERGVTAFLLSPAAVPEVISRNGPFLLPPK